MSARAIELDRTDVVFADLNASAAAYRAYAGTLSRPERARAERYRFEADRRRFVVARGRLREALASRLRTAPEAVPITERPGGKPVVAGETHLRFSVSRSGDLAAFAFSTVEIGIDLVSLRAGRFIAALAADIGSPAELAALARLDSESRIHALLTLWARKEALLKATGEGLVRTPTWFDVWKGATVEDLRITHGGHRWRIRDCAAPQGHILAVAESAS